MTTNSHHLYKVLKLCQFADSVLPIGGFAFSNGLESAIQLGIVKDEVSLKEFVLSVLKQNAHLDGVFVNYSFDLKKANDLKKMIELNDNYIAKRVGKEQQLMSSRVGSKLATLYLKITPSEFTENLVKELKTLDRPLNHPIMHGIISCENGLTRGESFATYQYGLAAMVLNAALRLMRIDHYQTQRILFEITETIDDLYDKVKDYHIDETISFAPIYDCLLAHHVDAHVRMFMN